MLGNGVDLQDGGGLGCTHSSQRRSLASRRSVEPVVSVHDAFRLPDACTPSRGTVDAATPPINLSMPAVPWLVHFPDRQATILMHGGKLPPETGEELVFGWIVDRHAPVDGARDDYDLEIWVTPKPGRPRRAGSAKGSADRSSRTGRRRTKADDPRSTNWG